MPVLESDKKIDINEVVTQRDYLDYTKQVHSYSPAIAKLVELSASYVSDAEAAYLSGKKKAIWSGGGWEAPFIYAFDTIPIAFGEVGRLSDKETMILAEDYYQFPVETCSMVKCVVGQWHQRRKSSSIKRILGNASQCEPYNMAWEIMKKEGYDIHTIDVIYRSPGTNGKRLDDLVNFFVEEIYGVAEWLTGSRNVDEDRLRFEIKRKNRLLEKVKRVLDLRLTHPFYLKTLPTILLLNIGLNAYFGKPEEFETMVDELIAELENEPVRQEDLDRVIPLVWAGGTGQEFGVYEAIDQAGGALLGLRGVPYKPYREDIPPVESLARWMYDNRRGGAGVHWRDILDQEVNKVKAKGIILYGVIGCSFQSIDKEMWRKYFHAKGIPSINLEGSFQTGAPTGQLMTRVRAFIEMLS